MSSSKTLFITGVSRGFGRALAEKALAAGHRVVGAVRSAEAKLEFEALDSTKAAGHVLGVTQFDAIDGVVAETEATIGPIDVLVNNAGYGHEGMMEESLLAEMRRQFDVKVFGAVAMMKAVLPYMRGRRHGHILNITSMGGFITHPVDRVSASHLENSSAVAASFSRTRLSASLTQQQMRRRREGLSIIVSMTCAALAELPNCLPLLSSRLLRTGSNCAS